MKMTGSAIVGVLFVVAAITLFSVPAVQAGFSTTGNVEPLDPSTWTSSTSAYIGNSADGALTIDADSDLLASRGYLGYNTGITGVVRVDGSGSTWTTTSSFYVGFYGAGLLAIVNGGTVDTGSAYLGNLLGSTGTATISGVNSRWATRGLFVGYSGTGTLGVANGGTVASLGTVNIGYSSGAKGTATVNGPASSWTTGVLQIGRSGSGVLRITGGGTVSGSDGFIGVNSGSTGIAFIHGADSKLAVNALAVGSSGTAKLGVSQGGAITTAANVSINSSSLLTADVGTGSSLSVVGGTGSLTNDGMIRLVAGAGAANGTHAPISAGTWAGTGTVQALGGVWDSTAHTVTVSDAAAATAGTPITIDLASTQRVLVTDGGKSVGASFQAASGSLTFGASAIFGSELASLQSLLDPGESVLSSWNFSLTGYTAGDPVYLSLFAGSGWSLSDLTIWYYDGTWSQYDAWDLAYDNAYASFAINGFSDYAVTGTAPVPIPAALWLLGPGLAGLIGMRRRFFK